MNSAAHLPRTGFKLMLVVRSGPDAGAAYQLLPPRVTIGRDPESNNVVVNDPKVSRNAVVIEFAPEEISIVDVSGKNKLNVNGNSGGQSGERVSIKGGDVIRLGDSELAFVVEAMQLPSLVPNLFPNAQSERNAPLSLVGASPHLGHGVHGAAQSKPKSSRSKKSGGRLPFYLVVGALLAGAIYIGNTQQTRKKLDRGIRTTSEIEKEITETDSRVAEAAKKRTFRTEEEKTRYEEAQRHYIEGFRDYQKGNYTRAMRSFETARAIDPEHVLARRYFRQAEKQRDEIITQQLLEGRRYREKNMFARCSSALEKALVMMPNKDDLKFKQAEAMKKECDVLGDRRF